MAQFQVTLWIELLAAALGGVQGALFAAERKDRRIDLLGVVVIGLTVALGGSLLRDVVLNQPPVVVWVNWYLVVAGAAALLGMALHPALVRTERLITVLDAIVMGLFGAIAASKALSLGVGSVGALVVGVIGAIGGGVLRDLILNRPISILHVGSLYAVAAGAGAAGLIVLVKIGAPVPIAGIVAVAVTTAVRLAAVLFDWTFPEQRALRPRPPRVGPPTRRAENVDRRGICASTARRRRGACTREREPGRLACPRPVPPRRSVSRHCTPPCRTAAQDGTSSRRCN